MKLSKILLQAILVGVTASAITSCDLVDTSTHLCDEDCQEVCTEKQKAERDREPCPGCGMG